MNLAPSREALSLAAVPFKDAGSDEGVGRQPPLTGPFRLRADYSVRIPPCSDLLAVPWPVTHTRARVQNSLRPCWSGQLRPGNAFVSTVLLAPGIQLADATAEGRPNMRPLWLRSRRSLGIEKGFSPAAPCPCLAQPGSPHSMLTIPCRVLLGPPSFSHGKLAAWLVFVSRA